MPDLSMPIFCRRFAACDTPALRLLRRLRRRLPLIEILYAAFYYCLLLMLPPCWLPLLFRHYVVTPRPLTALRRRYFYYAP